MKLFIRTALMTLLVIGVAGASGCSDDSSDDNGTQDTVQDTASRTDIELDTVDQDMTLEDNTIPQDNTVPEDIAEDKTIPEDVVADTPNPEDVLEDNTTPDVVEDNMTPDVVEDNMTPDVVEDNTTPDVVEDSTTPDVVEDIGNPEDCGYGASIAGLLNCEFGDVDVTLEGVLVTYVYEQGFFVYDDSSTLGMQVYVGNTWTYDVPTVGDVVNLHVTDYSSFYGTQEVTASDSLEVVGTSDVAAATVQIVTDDVLPSEDIEGRVVAGTGFTVVSVSGQNLTVNYGTQTDVTVRLDDAGDLCVNATFDLAASVITEYDGAHRIQSFHAADDVQNVDTAGCPVPPEYDTSNWDFEENSETDPPADFEKNTADFTALSVSDPIHGGSVACMLTWTSSSNQDMYQGYYSPVTGSADVTFTFWALDNDIGGRIRPAMTFYDADMGYLSNEYSNDYTVDSADWQEMTLTKTAPPLAVYARAYVRMYDVSSDWDGEASVAIDDWSFTAQ